MKLIETQVTSAINQSQSPAKLDAIKDHLLQQQVSQTRELQRLVKNCLCKQEVQKSENKVYASPSSLCGLYRSDRRSIYVSVFFLKSS